MVTVAHVRPSRLSVRSFADKLASESGLTFDCLSSQIACRKQATFMSIGSQLIPFGS
jgi:hypothetical protein